MNRLATLAAAALVASMGAALAETAPRSYSADPRIRYYTYSEHDVYRLDVYMRFITSIQFASGENIESVQVGDSASWQIVRLNRGDVLSVKPLVHGAYTNMTVYTDRRVYTFELNAKATQAGSNSPSYRISFNYPGEAARARQRQAEVAARPKDYSYFVAGKSTSIRPIQVYDDGVKTYFRFAPNAPRPSIFAANADGQEAIVNVQQTSEGFVVNRTSDRWTLRIGDEELCIASGEVVQSVRGGRQAQPANSNQVVIQ